MTEGEKTISFLPSRLNREATVFGGMTVSEFGLSAAIGFVMGLIIGLLLWILTDWWLLIPALAMLLCILTVLIGKGIVATLKRGKPEAYLNRKIEEKLDEILMGNKFIRREGAWSIRRQKGNRK
ncbi:TPA: TIGR03750 family conjugal transfer protein [Pasteurella multocida]|uniref:TIGR03750 family conjugal transfer protein n=1 Tax=Actinobacillus equuli subsp. equuli TaxID=202947 RepID=A0A9X4G502_ACTEU|nr:MULTISPECIES: TIGR03750 family conjugal transfer protein [Pasteurellaceae]MDE8035238.1 TIGR03750 family conjugal transfer protein [Actinobacillus equuli subsp. equuli]QCA32153.1 TIGR03750 family conjugal transfer protein [Pasteurella multocida]QXG51775.1 TIGR03750 family conjugal transfer protein [Pasteurella multocida]WGE13660.1 TIGR03750 family conjugal transfer protein [Pasteurella multocida]HDX0990427.1 TIGR03750 family conjugal transfer protein [Pasteurella multocida]